MNHQAWMISNPDIADMPDYGCHFQFEGVMTAPVSKIYEALTTKRGIQSWWTESCDVGSTVGSQITVRFGPTFALMQIESLQSDAVVQWQVIDSHLEVPGLVRTDEWIGTKINFRLEPESDSATRVRMDHIGLVPGQMGSKLADHPGGANQSDHLFRSCRCEASLRRDDDDEENRYLGD
jgi:uncharacterized protein YndB with AHSA1/START domain